MQAFFKRHVAFALILIVLCAVTAAASADDCFTLNVDRLDMSRLNSNDYVQRHLTAQAQGISVVKYISDSSELAAQVRLTLVRMDNQSLIFDKAYGYVSGVFDSGVIYLPYDSSSTVPYMVTLYVGDTVYAMPFMHVQAVAEQYDEYSEFSSDWDDAYEPGYPSWEDEPYGEDDPYEYEYEYEYGDDFDYDYNYGDDFDYDYDY